MNRGPMNKIPFILICGVIIGIIFIIFDMIIGIATSTLYLSYADLSIWKNPPEILAGVLFDLINGIILTTVFITIEKGIPGIGWKKGVHYGIIVGLFRVVMMSFSVFVLYSVPLTIVVTYLVTGFIEIVLLCIILVIIYDKLQKRKV